MKDTQPDTSTALVGPTPEVVDVQIDRNFGITINIFKHYISVNNIKLINKILQICSNIE